MTTTTKTNDFSTLESLNSNFSAARELFGWLEPKPGEYLSNYEQRATCVYIEGRPEPDPELLGIMLYEGVTVKSGDPGHEQINETMSDVIDEIVDEEWSSACIDDDADLRSWMPLKEDFMRDHNEFEAEWLQAIGMLPEVLRIDPQWDGERWSATCAAWDASVRDAIDGRDIDGFLREAIQQALQEAIVEAMAKIGNDDAEDDEEEED